MSLTEIRMVTQMSGPRGPGEYWPPVGGTLWVSEEEADFLCRQPDPLNPPIAVRVDQPRTETATAPEARVETATGAADATTERAVPPPPPVEVPEEAPEEPAKRGPGRPPGSKNQPK